MTLLEHYLKTVRVYLPKGPEQEDIITELAEYLQSTLDEKAEAMGRLLTEAEQEALLSRHGNPMVVAGRYGTKNLSVAFGRQLIGPELFPIYVRLLALNWALIVIVVFALVPFVDAPITPGRFVYPFVIQFLILTTIFSFIDYFQRRAKPRTNLLFPPHPLQLVPRWQSVSGGPVLGALGLWWAALPLTPRLLLGRAVDVVEFSSSATWIYLPVLLLLATGVAQRVTTYLRPDLNWVQSVVRLITNGTAVALLYPFAKSYPFVVVSPGASDLAAAELAARRVNGGLWWSVLGTLSFYWAITAAYHAWLCVAHSPCPPCQTVCEVRSAHVIACPQHRRLAVGPDRLRQSDGGTRAPTIALERIEWRSVVCRQLCELPRHRCHSGRQPIGARAHLSGQHSLRADAGVDDSTGLDVDEDRARGGGPVSHRRRARHIDAGIRPQSGQISTCAGTCDSESLPGW
jgi:hypothetical protein